MIKKALEFKSFGDALRHYRNRAELTLRDLGARARISSTYVSYLENNQSQSSKTGKAKPSLDVVDRLSRALGWSQSEARILAGYAPKDTKPFNDFTEYALNNFNEAKELNENEIREIEEVVRSLIRTKARLKK